METTTETVCWKCRGTGEFVWRSGERDVCYPCEGSGRCEAPPVNTGIAMGWTAEQARLTLRGFYKNATLSAEHPCFLEYGAIVGQGSTDMGWTHEGLCSLLDMVPRSREAFRTLGWPV